MNLPFLRRNKISGGSASERELRYFRNLLLIGIIAHPLIGLIRKFTDSQVYDPMYLRMITTSAGLLVYLLSFRSETVRKHFVLLLYILAYMVTIHIMAIMWVNHFSFNYLVGYFLILIAVGFIHNDVKQLFIYLVFINSGALVVSLMVKPVNISVSVFMSTSITMSLVIYQALKAKIVANKELDKINHLLLQEIQERKTAQEEVAQLNKELKQNLEEMESINDDLESFSYSAAHDLRAPLRIIQQFSTVLKRKSNSREDQESENMLDLIIRTTKEMDKLINDLIDFARLGKKQVRSQTIHMESLVKHVLDEILAGEITEKTHFNIHPLPEIKGDPSFIQQVWSNLISNALKYSSHKEEQIIEIGHRKGEDEDIFYVRDNGAGFDMRYVHKLFMIFQRLHNKEEFEGTGLGLAIVKRILEKHKGKVWADGRINEGATFYFSLPRNQNS